MIHFRPFKSFFSHNIFSHIFFVLTYHILNLYKISQMNSYTKMHVYGGTNNEPIHNFKFKSPLLLFGVCMLQFFNRCLLLQVDDLNLATILKKIVLWHDNSM
jgi:hypothetical protein